MKNRIFCFVLIAIVMAVTSCSAAPVRPIKNPDGYIRVYGRPGLVDKLFDKFVELHPDFRYEIMFIPSALTNSNNPDLDSLLTEENPPGPPDIIFAEGPDIIKCAQGDLSGHVISYEEPGIDVGSEIEAAGIFPYIVDIGTRPGDGKVVGLSYESTACAFIYRRTLAKEVWGTDDPDIVKTKIGPGWGKFFEADAELAKKGYYIGFVPHGAVNGWKSWTKGGKLYIGPEREAYLDYAKEHRGLTDFNEMTYFGDFGPAYRVTHDLAHSEVGQDHPGDWAVCDPPAGYYENGTWIFANKELDKDPKKKVAVAEFIEWMTLDCTKQGLQYYMANGMLKFGFDDTGFKDEVASCTVMKMSDGRTDFLGGQDLFDAYISASQLVEGKNITESDIAIGSIWRKYVYDYADGKHTYFEAIVLFKREVKEQLGIDAL